jgi:hypothetical protein
MKYRLLLLVCSVLLFSACKKNSTPQPVVVIKTSMTFTVDGVQKTMDNVLTAYTTIQTVSPAGTVLMLNIEGATLSDEILRITIPNPAVGTFSTGVGFDYLFPPTDAQNNQYIGPGTVVVTTYTNTQIAGTFSFTGYNNGTPVLTKNITSGSFSTTISSH